jgi:hypothetical protein
VSPSRIQYGIAVWGETLCLNYANSVDWSPEDEHVDPEQTDVLRAEGMLGRWGRRCDLLGEDAKRASAAESSRARSLRDAVYRLFSSIGRGRGPASRDLDLLMSNYAEAVSHASLRAGEDLYKLDWPRWDPRRIRFAVVTEETASRPLRSSAAESRRAPKWSGGEAGTHADTQAPQQGHVDHGPPSWTT